MKIGIVGLPNVGKSTLFKTITEKEVVIANYPFATIDPNIGVVAIPDERLQKLAEFLILKNCTSHNRICRYCRISKRRFARLRFRQ